MIGCLNIFATRPGWFSPEGRWTGCTPPTAAQRMAIHSERRAAEMAEREALGAAAPRVRLVDGRPVLIALPGTVNALRSSVNQYEKELP